MADTLVDRVIGRRVRTTEDTAPSARVLVSLVVSDAVLWGTSTEPGHLDGYGPVPADLARELAGTAAGAWLRRIYVRPETGHLVASDSRARLMPAGMAALIRLRDRTCRTPWCDAPIRHIDHVVAVHESGDTSVDNCQGLCEACNYAKTAIGWRARPRPGPRHGVSITTPTGHHYESVATPVKTPRFVERQPGVWALAS